MSFTSAELQQIKSLVAEKVKSLEEFKATMKTNIGHAVAAKKPYKEARLKGVVDQINETIRRQYNEIDKIDKKLKKLVSLQQAVKRGLSENGKEEREVPKPTQKLVDAMARFRESHVVQTSGYAQVEPPIANAQLTSFATTNPGVSDSLLMSSGVSPQGWQDKVMENFPSYRTLELRPSDIHNPDPSYDQPQLDPRWYTIPKEDVSAKPSNPKDMIGSGKLPFHLWPQTATAMGCIGFLNGMLKYGRANFRVHGIRASIYIDAAFRHLSAWFEGEECDPDDGVPHLAAALACIAIIVDAQAAGKLNDDRQVRGGYHALVASLTPHVARLKALHAAKSPRHYTIADNASLV